MLLNKWIKASKSGGNNTGPNCVQCLQFRKASASAADIANCVETAVATDEAHAHCTPGQCLAEGIDTGDLIVRDSKAGPGSPVAVFTPRLWELYVASVADGRSDVVDGSHVIIDPRGTGTVLRFTDGEWDAFVDGCRKGEFALATAEPVQAVGDGDRIMSGSHHYTRSGTDNRSGRHGNLAGPGAL
jgi:hypothetical protein